jgi:thioredoxin 1
VSGDLLVTTPIDFNALRSSGLPVIIDFGADSCIPCKEMAPVLADLNTSLQGKAIIKFVDVWKYRELSEGVPLKVIPTQVFFDSTGKPFNPPDTVQLPFNRYSRNDTKEHMFTAHEGGLDKQQLLAILKEMGMKE